MADYLIFRLEGLAARVPLGYWFARWLSLRALDYS